jgi:hypothetical protein
LYQDASQSARLPIGVSNGSVLTTDGTLTLFGQMLKEKMLFTLQTLVSDTANPGTQFLPYKTHLQKHYLLATSGDAS